MSTEQIRMMAQATTEQLRELQRWTNELNSDGFPWESRWALWHGLKFTTRMLEADVEVGGLGLQTHPRQAEQLLRLDTEARRWRAYDEACTLQNLVGGVMSGCLSDAVTSLLRLIEQDDESSELYGERAARVAREQEAELRRISGNPQAIHYPPEMRRF